MHCIPSSKGFSPGGIAKASVNSANIGIECDPKRDELAMSRVNLIER